MRSVLLGRLGRGLGWLLSRLRSRVYEGPASGVSEDLPEDVEVMMPGMVIYYPAQEERDD